MRQLAFTCVLAFGIAAPPVATQGYGEPTILASIPIPPRPAPVAAPPVTAAAIHPDALQDIPAVPANLSDVYADLQTLLDDIEAKRDTQNYDDMVVRNTMYVFCEAAGNIADNAQSCLNALSSLQDLTEQEAATIQSLQSRLSGFTPS